MDYSLMAFRPAEREAEREPSLDAARDSALQDCAKPPAPHRGSNSDCDSNDSEGFAYMLNRAATTDEALQQLHRIQVGDASDSDPASDSDSAGPPRREPHKRAGGLPATLQEFYGTPNYTVSLTTARTSVMCDALSGFHSYVVRERSEVLHGALHRVFPPQYIRTFETQGGIPCVSARLAPIAEAGGDVHQSYPAALMFLMRADDRDGVRHDMPAGAAEPASAAAADSAQRTDAELQDLYRQTYLREKEYQRLRVPLVFRVKYPPEFVSTPEQSRLRNAVDAAENNMLRGEWPYVWEQFQRDVRREVLYVGGQPYQEASEALAAVESYLEYCFARGAAETRVRRQKLEEEQRQRREQSTSWLQSVYTAGTAALRNAVVRVARSELPSALSNPLLAATGLDPDALRTAPYYPDDPKSRGHALFAATREVILAAQQSFMGFPYQLLCEQVGTERMALAMEALEAEEDVDGGSHTASTDAGNSQPRRVLRIYHNGSFMEHAEAADQRREKQLERERRLPLLVGEPRAAEFATFLRHIRASVEKKFSSEGRPMPAAGSADEDQLFREDVDGSVYLLPVERKARQAAPRPPRGDGEQAAADEADGDAPLPSACAWGMRIHLYYNAKRCAPVVCVNKLFRLFTVPGLSALSSPSSAAAAPPPDAPADPEVRALPQATTAAAPEQGSEESVLLLIQIEFTLFSQEEVEVRWKWWRGQ